MSTYSDKVAEKIDNFIAAILHRAKGGSQKNVENARERLHEALAEWDTALRSAADWD